MISAADLEGAFIRSRILGLRIMRHGPTGVSANKWVVAGRWNAAEGDPKAKVAMTDDVSLEKALIDLLKFTPTNPGAAPDNLEDLL